MPNQVKNILIFLVISVVAVVGAAILFSKASGPASVEEQRVLGSVRWEKGNSEAELVVVEFSDFQCLRCAEVAIQVKELVDKYGDHVRFVYRHFPLTATHEYAFQAAVASEIAGQKGKFWEMHDLLFERQKEWESGDDVVEKFASYAEEIGLDRESFVEPFDEDSYEENVWKDLGDARALRLIKTPTFFVGEQQVDVDKLEEVLAASLEDNQ
jgi:protein-disulfide isomerase